MESLFSHLEKVCENFKYGFPKRTYNREQKQIVCKFSFNAKKTPLTETPEPEFSARPLQTHINLTMCSHKKENRPIKKFLLAKEFDVPNLAIGQIHLKSFQFCVFPLFVKCRNIKFHIAYRVDENNIEVLDIIEEKVCATLKGHSDLVSEIKYVKTKKDYNLLLSSSYDCNLLIWEVSTFKMVKKIKTNSWVLSSTIAGINDQEFVYTAGGYAKDSPIRAFELETGTLIYEINLKEDAIPVLIEKFNANKMNYLFVGTDSENPKFIIIDYNIKQIIKSFVMKNPICAIALYCSSTTQLFAYTADYLGMISEIDVTKAKLNTEFSVGNNCLDLISYDDYYLITCGDRNNSIKSLIRHKHRVGKTFPEIHDKVILNIQKMIVPNFGACLFTLSADKKIKMFKY